jgi:peptidoglycan/xylan/chitin deacetylase (PgdA/CDA1 family)
MKRILLIIIFSVILPLSANAENYRIPILMYHHILVTDKLTGVLKDLSCSPGLFRSHLDYLQENGYHIITFKDVMSGNTPNKPVILTFDDGSLSQWQAYEELSRRGMKGVFFITVRFLDGHGMLSSKQIETMLSSSMEIGSHTLTHPNLPRIKWSEAEKEIRQSKSELESRFKTNVVSFAYPYGAYSGRLMGVVENAGYHYGRTTNESVAYFGREKNFNLPIVYIHCNTKDLGRLLK